MTLGICAIFKDEAPYLHEWVNFHRLQGVDAFYLYDNDSTDDWRTEIPELVKSVLPWPGPIRQIHAYQHCLATRARTDWIAFIDIDEFLFDENTRPLPLLLDEIEEEFSMVEVKWRMYGDGGHVVQPDGLVIDCFLRCEENLHALGKQIVRRGRAKIAYDPHTFDGDGLPVQIAGLRLNHYWTKSQAECLAKFERGRADLAQGRHWDEFLDTRENLFATVDATASLLFGKQIRELDSI